MRGRNLGSGPQSADLSALMKWCLSLGVSMGLTHPQLPMVTAFLIQAPGPLSHILFPFRHRNALFPHGRFSTLFFSMKEAESGNIVFVSCIIDFKDKQV
jgi:hypothetical protein